MKLRLFTQLGLLAILLASAGIGGANAAGASVSQPNPQYPINNVLVLTDTPTLKWSASTPTGNLDYYEYEVSQDAGFSTTDDSGTSTTTQATVGIALTRSRTYYWRVHACDTSANCTGWAVAKFRVSVDAPLLISPSDTDFLFTNRDTFDWDSVSNATGYTIQISGSSIFSSLILQADVPASQTEYTPAADLPANRILFWRVRAKNPDYGPGPWSTVWSFNTANPPSIPQPLQPRNGKLTTDTSPRLVWKDNVTIPSGTTFTKYHVQVDDNADFSSPDIDDDTTLTTLTPTYYDVDESAPLNDATTYYWRVRACNTDGTNDFCSAWSTPFKLLTSVGPITPIDPVNGDALQDNRPLFDWSDSTGATRYTIQIARDPLFRNIVLKAATLNSQFRPRKSLPPGRTLYWRVRGEHYTYGPGLWSPVWSFTTANPPRRPSPLSPASGALVHTDTPTLMWSFSSTPLGTTFDYYQVQIDDTPDFSSPVEDQTIYDQFTPFFLDTDYSAPLSRLTTYRWRVRACNDSNGGACSDWSYVRTFRVAIEAPTSLLCGTPTIDWDDMTGAAKYRVVIFRGSTKVRDLIVTASQANIGSLPNGTYTCKVRVERTFAPGYAPSLWSVDTFTVP